MGLLQGRLARKQKGDLDGRHASHACMLHGRHAPRRASSSSVFRSCGARRPLHVRVCKTRSERGWCGTRWHGRVQTGELGM
eukprot:966257-Pleurochrysis_carterae.AAC.1